MASLDSEEELTKTWRICTNVKDSLENGWRLENLSWRLWHLHKLILDDKRHAAEVAVAAEEASSSASSLKRRLRSSADVQRVSTETTRKLALDGVSSDDKAGDLFSSVTRRSKEVPVDVADHPLLIPLPLTHVQGIKRSLQLEECKSVVENHHAIQFDDLFGPFAATAFLGDLEQGPWLEVPDDLSLSAFNIYDPNSAHGLFHTEFLDHDISGYPLSTLMAGTPSNSSASSSTTSWPAQLNMYNNDTSVLKRSHNSLYQFQPDPSSSAHPQPGMDFSGIFSRDFSNDASNHLQVAPHTTFSPVTSVNRHSDTMMGRQKALAEHNCSNCHVSTSPLWRKLEDKTELCNACGLFYKQHGTKRPLTVRASQRKLKADAVCANCGTTNTPLWRKNDLQQVLCNACGLFWKMHNKHRPLHMKTDIIKKRPRQDSAGKRSSGSVLYSAQPMDISAQSGALRVLAGQDAQVPDVKPTI